jgi:hypothetical protein
MSEGNSHGENLIGTSQIELVVKLLILRVFDLLANDSIICDIRTSQEESHGSFKSRVLYAVLPVQPLPASLSFNSARTLRANSIGRNGFSR